MPPRVQKGAPDAPPAKPVRAKARSPYLWLQRLLLMLGVLAVLGVGVLLAAYRFGSSGQQAEEATARKLAADSDDAFSGLGFDHTQTSDGQPIFRIRANRNRHDKDGRVHLEDEVELTLFREDGGHYTVTSDRARYIQKSGHAELEGRVVVKGWDKLELRARALELRNGLVLVSQGAVQFDYPPHLEGRASRLRVDFKKDAISLTDGVHVRSKDGAPYELQLDTERLYYQRQDRLIRAVGDAFLKRDGNEISAETLSVFLLDDLSTLEAIRARFDVRGRLVTAGEPGAGSRVDYRGGKLVIQMDPELGQPRRMELEADADNPTAEIQITQDDGLARRFTGRFFNGRIEGGQLQLIEGVGSPLRLTEMLDFDEPHILRQACAEKGEGRFLPDGSLGWMRLEQQVELRDRDIQLTGGDRADLDLGNGRIEVQGDAVELHNERGELVAPKVSFSRETGVVRASNGVSAAIEAGAMSALSGSPLGRGEGPVRIESKEALWTISPSTFSFRGDVRAWRGDSLVLAEQLRGEEAAQQLSASGKVKTIFRPESGTVGGEPIEVKADRLSYRQAENRLIYDGKVHVRQEKRTLDCAELIVELSASGGQAERMRCRGDVHMIDNVSGREVFGARALYTLKEQKVEVFGNAVRLIDGESKMQGKYLLYDVREGGVSLKSSPPSGAGGAVQGGAP